MPRPLSKNVLFMLVYLVSFLYSFHYALPLYIESSFIVQFLNETSLFGFEFSTERLVGLIFSVAALLSAIITFLYPRILKRYGNYRTTVATMSLEVIALLALASTTDTPTVIALFILHQILVNIIYLNLDSFVETFSEDTKTGGIRGVFMTILNIAIAVAPFMAGLMLTDHDFWKVYLASAVFMAIGTLIVIKNFRTHVDPSYSVPTFKETFKRIADSHDLHSIIFLHFLLAFFYSWMVIYTPIYLDKNMGIEMKDILSIIIPIALIPFIIFEVGLGKIADTKLGEKEILTAGFIIMAISTAGLSFITTSSVAIWAMALFLTRTGASAVEVMTESYFYKQVGPGDIHIITFMRTIRSVAYMVGPLIGSIVLSFVDYHNLFLVLGVIMLTALPYSLTIKDTK